MSFRSFKFNFPPVDDSLYTGTDDQTRHIMEEAAEARAARNGDEHEYLMELWDVIHAVETELRHQPDKDVRSAYKAVVEKNAKRGYYGAKWASDGFSAAPSDIQGAEGAR